MAGVRLWSLKSLCGNFINPTVKLQPFRSYNSYSIVSRNVNQTHVRSLHVTANRSYYNGVLGNRWYSSSLAGTGDKGWSLKTLAASNGSDAGAGSDSGVFGGDWADKIRSTWQNAVEAVNHTGDKAKEAYDGVAPHVHQLLDAHPFFKDVVVPIGWTLTGTVMVWVVMPGILRRLHKYSMQTPAATLLGERVPYEKSFWGALEDPVRYLVTFMAFSQITVMVAPDAIASQYLTQAWRGAAILSLVWFLHRWKTNVISHLIAAQNLEKLEREKLLTLDRVSSVGLFVIGIMALAEACGVAVQSILTVGGIGGVATAFAARDILGNILSGLSMQFSKPFSLGDTIKAGSIEGQVVEMGLTTTSLLTTEKFPVLVPNSLFSSQVIVNKSRGEWRAISAKIPIKADDYEKIPQMSDHIKSMLKLHPNVFLDKEVPYCFLSRIESSFAELNLGCNLIQMSKEEFYSTQQDILLQSVRIIKEHGATLGSTWQENSL